MVDSIPCGEKLYRSEEARVNGVGRQRLGSESDYSYFTRSEIIALMNSQDEFLHRVTRLYKGFEIQVQAMAIRGHEGTFTAHVTIVKDARSYRDETPFHSGQVFKDVNAALEAGIEIGKRKIDESFVSKPL